MSITLAEIKTNARSLADMVANDFVTDAELLVYINTAIAQLHDMLIEAYDDEYFINLSSPALTTIGTASYSLPTDFYKLKGVDIKLDSVNWLSIQPFNFNERNKYADFGTWMLNGQTNVRYRILGSNILFTPVPDTSVYYRIGYVPVATKLSVDADVYNDFNQYSEYVVLSAAIKMLNKQELDASNLSEERDRIIKHINEAKLNRDSSRASSISDIYGENNNYLWYVSKG